MRMATAVLAAFLAMAATAPSGADPPSGATGRRPGEVPLPEALEALYPPVAGGAVYLIQMAELQTSFSGIVVDLMEDDIEGARGSFEDFGKLYRETAGMVPEWKEGFPEKPVRELGAALSSGDKALAMQAIDAVGGICHRCHVEAMVPVQQRYRWGDFGAAIVKDPLSGAPTGYAQFKRFMATNLAGITVDLKQGQTENARKQFEGFRARFRALGDSCQGCHEGKTVAFVGNDVQDVLVEMGSAFGGETVDANAVAALTRRIGRESCSKCHLVHVPAAFAGTPRRRTR